MYKDKEKQKETRKKWNLNNKDRLKEIHKNYLTNHPEQILKKNNRQKMNGKNIARSKYYSFAKMFLSDIDKQCQVCGELKTEFHHIDYTKPLLGYHLCQKHHQEAHKDNTILNNIIIKDYFMESLKKRGYVILKDKYYN